ncbi:uncharacterized protein LAESUDRAFT_22275 [Laetiporus sulphureus 93-53]|uniref:Aminoacyl-transfer RNA synthetases class-II family profile domain-containing protein n=1 Tax=Laetiporus sulphureus 93-53 TaxID=1314785 RepID=A0A165IE24_9APHY|nr:uncharacterized protein LAESUDRAFT_22275 [Laetiporus sulphureus 93-53]KZT12950.1 hypothetical protein LAESUDRAFT_22275 [Laetiporus sulphureus 93-53]
MRVVLRDILSRCSIRHLARARWIACQSRRNVTSSCNLQVSSSAVDAIALVSAHVAHCRPFPKRTHTCKSLSSNEVDRRVVLTGWLLPERKVNKELSFFNLRDPYGTLQLVVAANTCGEALSRMRDIPTESTVLLQGLVKARTEDHRRPYPGGDIEILVESFMLLNPADRSLPFMPNDTQNLANEHLRLRYRYLDLRRDALSSNLKKRSEVAHIIRTVLHEQDFTEVETPVLLKSTPEGAREFLVPTRVTTNPAEDGSPESHQPTSQPLFYALPQSPQQPKQLLIASGAIDRYYQLARCFRDEDGRKDRQPEFTQVDLEMAWVSWGEHTNAKGHQVDTKVSTSVDEDNGTDLSRSPDSWRIGGHEVRDIVERLVRRVWLEVEGVELPAKFNVTTYDTAMGRYGSDKPDLRFKLEIEDITPYLPLSMRQLLASTGEIIEALVVRRSRSTDVPFLGAVEELHAKGITGTESVDVPTGADTTWVKQSKTLQEVLTKLEEGTENQELPHLTEALDLNMGGTVWLTRRRRRPEGGSTALGRVRLELASLAQSRGDLTLPCDPHFLWVTEFPLFTHADTDKEFLAHGRWSSSHHPFTAPMWQDIEKMYGGDVAEVRGQHYDLVLNGVEIGGGSVRVHDAAMQGYIFAQILQLDDHETNSFEHLLHALRCGAPPHGGFAFGFDRLMAILCKTESIRDVIAFPKTGAGTDLLFRSPAPASASVLAQYGIRPR